MTSTPDLSHRLSRMRGRDPHESGRVASNLELLFDLTFVVAFGIAGNEFPHMAAEGEILLASAGYVFVLFSVIWPWVNYTWFASAFDTDDWAYRLVTMVIMCGVVVLALGIPPFFDSLHHGHVDNTVMVMGYVVMRIGMALHWGGPICKRRSSEPGRESTLRPCWRRRSVG